MKYLRIVLLLVVIPVLTMDFTGQPVENKLERVLTMAQKNRQELMKTIEYFRQKGNKEMLNAALFLILNMENKYCLQGDLMSKYDPFFLYLDSLNKNGIPKKDKKNDKLQKYVEDRWKTVTGTITPGDQRTVSRVDDLTSISSTYLIKTVEQAYAEWKGNAWSKNFDFDTFCEYILPYRVFTETPEDWRPYFSQRYTNVKKHFAQNPDPLAIADSVNKEVESWFKFATLFYQYPFDMGLTRLTQSHLGNCNHMVTAAIYALRSVGVPCAVDRCLQYGNRSLGHTWVALLDKDGNTVPVNGASTEWLGMGYVFSEQTLNVTLPKVLRKTVAIHDSSLLVLMNKEKVNSIFEDLQFKDVTPEYMPVTDVVVNVNPKLKISTKMAYLCVFNNKSWVPVWWGEIKNGKALFKNMGRDIVYLPAVLTGSSLIPISEPIILSKDGVVKPIVRYKGRAQAAKLFDKYPPALTGNNDSTNAILPTDTYELFYWDNTWVPLGKKTVADRQADLDSLGFDFKRKLFFSDINGREYLFYENVPVGTLFLLHNYTQGKEERIFTIEDGKQVWW